MMRLSYNEIETTLVKAATGAGLEAGVAQDVARAGRWLCEQGQDGVAIVAAALAGEGGAGERAAGRQTEPATITTVNHLVSLADRAVSGGLGNEIREADLPVAMLALGLLGVAAHDHRLAFVLQVSSACAVISPGGVTMDAGFGAPGSAIITVAQAADENGRRSCRATAPEPNADDWRRILQLAARTYVPASAQSRERGAGSGLLDND